MRTASLRRRDVPPAYERHHQQHIALLETVRAALADNRVDLYLQAVVSLPQRRTVFYESFSRLRDATGRVMMPAEYLSVAEPEGLMPAIDNLLAVPLRADRPAPGQEATARSASSATSP